MHNLKKEQILLKLKKEFPETRAWETDTVKLENNNLEVKIWVDAKAVNITTIKTYEILKSYLIWADNYPGYVMDIKELFDERETGLICKYNASK